MHSLSAESLLDQLREGAILLDRDFRIESCNNSFSALSGKASGELHGMHLADLAASGRDRLVLSTPSPDSSPTVRIKTASGRKIKVEMSFSPLLNGENEPDGYVVLVRDVSQAAARDEKLRITLEKYRDISFAGADWLWEIDSAGTYVYISPSVEEHLGYSPGDMFGRTPFEFLSSQESERAAAAFTALALQGKPVIRYRSNIIAASGEVKVVETSGVPIYDSSGNLKGYRGLDRDVTEQVRIAGELKSSLEQTRTILEKLPVGVVLIDKSKRVREINKAACLITGCSMGDIVGKVCHNLMCPAMENRCPILDLGQTVDNAERYVLHKDGRMIPVVKTVLPVRLGGEDLLLEVFTDVSEIRSLRSSLTAQNRKLEDALSVLEKKETRFRARSRRTAARHGQFLVSILDSLSVMDSAIRDLLSSPGEGQEEQLSLLKREHHGMVSALRDLRELTQREMAVFSKARELFSITTLMKKVEKRLADLGKGKAVSSEVVIGSDLPGLWEGPAEGILSALSGLLERTLVADEPSSVHLGVSAMPGGVGNEMTVRFSVARSPGQGWTEIPTELGEHMDDHSTIPEFVVNAELFGGEFHFKESENGFLAWLDVPMTAWQKCESSRNGKYARGFVISGDPSLDELYRETLKQAGCPSAELISADDLPGILGGLSPNDNAVFLLDLDRRELSQKSLALLKAAGKAEGALVSTVGVIAQLERRQREDYSRHGCTAILLKPLYPCRLKECLTVLSCDPRALVTDLSLPPR